MISLLNPDGIVATRISRATRGSFSPFPEMLEPLIIKGLQKSGIKSLYAHQANAVTSILSGKNTIITTSTSSGKSMVYSIPILNEYAKDTKSRAIYLSPAKALGQNQRGTLQELCKMFAWPQQSPIVDVCDGDTGTSKRRQILQESNVIITTPDMLHASILQRHRQTPELFKNLKYVAIDEAHTLGGVLGNHVAHVLRRLRRICRYYGTEPTFILCTATIANAQEFAKNLVGTEFTVIDKDGAPQGKKDFVFYRPPLIEGEGEESRPFIRPVHHEAAYEMGKFIQNGRRVIVFCKSRKQVEGAYKAFAEEYPALAGQVTAYKGTLSAQYRRDIEESLFTGELKGVFATSALELGIDIGDLDVCVIAGFPGSISSAWQMAGRAGRKKQDSLIVFMADSDPLDSYIVENCDYFFSDSEMAIVDPDRDTFARLHLARAAQELPLQNDDSALWGEKYGQWIEQLESENTLEPIESVSGTVYVPCSEADRFGIRGESDKFKIIDSAGDVLEEYTRHLLLTDAYPGGIISSQGVDYVVRKIDYGKKEVTVSNIPAYLRGCATIPAMIRSILSFDVERELVLTNVTAYAGNLSALSSINGYTLKNGRGVRTKCSLSQSIPPMKLDTCGICFEFDERRIGTLHAIEHLLRIVVPWFVIADRNDLDGIIEPSKGRIYLWDNYPGGIGLTNGVLDYTGLILKRCLEVITACSCEYGCPKCLVIPQCLGKNENLDKEGAIEMLKK